MNLCEKTKEMLVLFTEDELSSEEKNFVRAHLEECDECRTELAKYQSIMKNLAPQEYSLPVSYSSELIVTINDRISKEKFRGLKLIPVVSFASVVLVVAVTMLFNFNTDQTNSIVSEDYILYKQYTGTSFYDDTEIYEETEEIADKLMPEDYIQSSQEYLLENTDEYSEAYSEIFGDLDDEAFDEIINNLKNIEI